MGQIIDLRAEGIGYLKIIDLLGNVDLRDCIVSQEFIIMMITAARRNATKPAREKLQFRQ